MDNGFFFKKEPRENVREIYHFIQKSREERGLSINIPFDRLDKIMAQYTNQYQMFSIRSREGELVACTIMVFVADKVVYNYLPAFNRDFSVFSPLALLHYKLYEHFASMKFSHIDLGISSIHGVPQESLISFKEKMGGIQSSRLTYQFDY